MIDHFGAPWTAPDRYRLRDDARRFENWEHAYALTLGLGTAADYALDLGMDAIRDRTFGLAEALRDGLGALAEFTVQDLGTEKCAIVGFSHDRVDAPAIVAELRNLGVNLSASQPSSTLLDATARELPVLVRASPHYYNTEQELDVLLDSLRDI